MKPANAPKQSQDVALEYEKIFQRYVEICNEAIEKNKNIFPYTEIWGARMQALEEDMLLHAIVLDDRPKAAFKLRLTKDMKIHIEKHKSPAPDDAWPFTYQYLKRVVDHPQDYIDHPAKLEWAWLAKIFDGI